MRKRIPKNHQQSATLIELVIFIAVLAVCISPIFLLFKYAIDTGIQNDLIIQLTYLAQAKMEELLLRDFFDLRDNNPGSESGNFSSLGAKFQDYWYIIFKHCLNPNDLTPLASGARSNYLRLHLRVWNTDYPNKWVELYLLRTPVKY